jgi:hypothetical protein
VRHVRLSTNDDARPEATIEVAAEVLAGER